MVSPYRGVTWDPKKNRWRARIYIKGREIYIGRFINDGDAARAYNKVAKQYGRELNKVGFCERKTR